MLDRYPEELEFASTADDIERIVAEGRIASLIGVEGGHCIEESLGVAAQAARAGRPLHDPHPRRHDQLGPIPGTDEERNGGLTDFGHVAWSAR